MARLNVLVCRDTHAQAEIGLTEDDGNTGDSGKKSAHALAQQQAACRDGHQVQKCQAALYSTGGMTEQGQCKNVAYEQPADQPLRYFPVLSSPKYQQHQQT